ncbi:MAG: helix-turn-helix transcriptional regulator [Kiritimatiellae bacterium]|nr:helix-turn-helix transcriptional regulator [Kiritimatiellia bacterium]
MSERKPKPNSASRLGPGGLMTQLRAGIKVRGSGDNERGFVTSQYAVVYVVEGRGTYEDNRGTAFALYPGTFFQRFPDRPHSDVLEPPVTRCHLAVPRQVYETMRMTGLVDENVPVHDIGVDLTIVDRIGAICEDLKQRPENGLMWPLLDMQRLIVEMHGRSPTGPGRRPSPGIEEACRLLGRDFDRRLTLPAVARAVRMSYSAFRKAFLKAVGVSPGDYRIRRRIERAMELLGEERLRVGEIAGALGYGDVYAFSAQFRKVTGLAPTEFRRRYR